METSVDDSIARSLQADPVLMPVLDHLLQDLDTLGGIPEQIVDLIRPLTMRGIRLVLDLGCGKGTVAAALASELDVLVTGIDAYPPFIAEGRQLAGHLKLGDRCMFAEADMRKLVGRLPAFDVVLLIACGNVFGDLETTMSSLRTFVRPGGFMVFDRDYATEGAAGSKGEAFGYEDAVATLTAHGDRIVMEKHGVSHHAIELSERAARVVERRVREMMRLYPGLAASMWEFVAAQRVTASRLSGSSASALWVVQTNESEPTADG